MEFFLTAQAAERRAPASLESAFASLFIADSDGVVDLGEENLPIADFSSARGGDDCLHGFFDQVIGKHQLQLDFGNQVDGVFPAAIELGMPFLPTVAAGFEHRHAFDADLVEGILYSVELRCLDHRFQLGHASLASAFPAILVAAAGPTKPGALYTRRERRAREE